MGFCCHAPLVIRASTAINGNIPQLGDEISYDKNLLEHSIFEMKNHCDNAAKSNSNNTLRRLGDNIMNSFSVNDSFDIAIEKIEALLACKSPAKAQQIIKAIEPVNTAQNRKWSLLLWRSSNALMDHQTASFALRRLSEGDLKVLDETEIEVGYRLDGSPLTRLALDLLAEHERLIGRCDLAAQVLLAGRKRGAVAARRISKAVQCLEGFSVEGRKGLLEKAIEDAKADEAWWLVGDILKLQLILYLTSGEDAKTLKNRLASYMKEIDDRYAQWELIRKENSKFDTRTFMENELQDLKEIKLDDKLRN